MMERNKIDNIKIGKVLIISGQGGFSAQANALSQDNKFELIRPEDLKIGIAVVHKISNDKLLGVDIHILPFSNELIIHVPKQVTIPDK